MRIKMVFPLLASLFVLVLVSACSQVTVTGGNANTSKLTPLQVLQNSEKAMSQLKSAHIDLKSTSNVHVVGLSIGTPTPTASGTSTNNLTLNVTGSGDEQLPNAERLSLTLNQGTKVAEIVQGNDVYVQNTQGKWYVLNKSDLQGSLGSTFSGVNINQNDLLALLEHSKITDYGDQNLNGQSLRHISASLDKTGIQQLLKDNPQLSGNLSQQQINELLNNTKSLQSSIDVWIDESQFYVHQTEVKLNLVTASANATPTTGSLSGISANVNSDSVIDLSKFNETVTITPPANATPTSDPTVIFG